MLGLQLRGAVSEVERRGVRLRDMEVILTSQTAILCPHFGASLSTYGRRSRAQVGEKLQ